MAFPKLRSLLYPTLPRDEWCALIAYLIAGSLVAGCYGIVHDQITYTLSPEYYTQLKFEQFGYARLGMPDRGFVAAIGFLASWWVGLIAGWIFARVGVAGPRPQLSKSTIWGAFALMLGGVFLGGLVGYLYGTLTYDSAPERWQVWSDDYDVVNLSDFARVGLIHICGYLGAIVALIFATTRLRKKRKALAA